MDLTDLIRKIIGLQEETKEPVEGAPHLAAIAGQGPPNPGVGPLADAVAQYGENAAGLGGAAQLQDQLQQVSQADDAKARQLAILQALASLKPGAVASALPKR